MIGSAVKWLPSNAEMDPQFAPEKASMRYPLLLLSAVIGSTLSVGAWTNAARGEVVGADSLEWVVADSEVIVRGVLKEVRSENGLWGEAVIGVEETLKGKHQDEWRKAARIEGWPAQVDKKRPTVLAFLKGGEVTQILLLDQSAIEPESKRLIHTWNFWRGAVNMEGRILWSAGDKLHAVREAVEFGADLPPPKAAAIDLMGEVPGSRGDGEFRYLYGGSAVFVRVPLDARLEQIARSWVSNEQPYEFWREQGTALLKRLREASGP